MKIAFVLTSLANVGPVIVVKDLISELPHDCEVTVFHLDDLVGIKLREGTIIRKISFFENVDFSQFDVVHSHMMRADMFCTLRRRQIRKLVTTMHSDFKRDLVMSHGRLVGGLASAVWYGCLLTFDKCVFLTKTQMRRYPIVRKGAVIYNGRPAPQPTATVTSAETKHISEKIVLGTCAHVVKRKGLDQVIDFLASDASDRYIFRLVGDGPFLEELKSYAMSKGVFEKCEFVGRQTNVYPYLAGFDMYVLTSHSEGMPLALIEAASIQVPIVCSRLPVLQEVFSEDEISYYNVGDIKDFADAVERCAKDAQAQAGRAFMRYREKYTSKAMADQYLDVFLQPSV
jgi:glycosyltransferase involved in cell wall biosynthesis